MPEATGRGRFGLFNMRELGVALALALIVVLFSLLSPYFFNISNFINIVRQVSLLGIIAMGMTLVIVCGEIDLSVGSIYGAAGIAAGVLMVGGHAVGSSVILGLAAGVFFGVANGVLVAQVRIPAMIVTLGMMNAARGLALIFSGGRVVNISPRTVKADGLDWFLFMGQGRVGEIPVMSLVFAAVVIAAYFLYHHTLLGFRMRAVGGSRAAARASGINDKLVKIAAFGIAGLLSAIAGQLNIAFLGNVQGTTGQGMELNAIAAVIIGGTTLSGGEGTILGTLIGVLIMGVLNNGIVLLGVSPFWQMTIIGAVIVGAVAIDKWTRKDAQA
ncbi:MAG: ABC transporter permease [Planctomycetota bacterium]|jgi:ribose/xylose/arabinose/galactoside ABC-type transport system permease subunit|nr:ABC transporter permease [Planctomycetota bacterium]